MSSNPAQVVDPQEFIPLLDYHFTGDDVTIGNKRTFITHLRTKAAVYRAAEATGVSKMTVYRWRDADSQFASAWEEALEDARENMETSVYEDAMAGNALLKMFWLKAHAPKYRDKVLVDIQSLDEEIRERMEQMDIKQLPVSTMHFLDQPDDQQKEALQQPVAATTDNNNSR